SLDRVRFNTPVGEDEIDLDSGFLIMPQAVPVAPTHATGTRLTAVETGNTGEPPLILSPPPNESPVGSAQQKSVEISFSAGRDQLYSAWNAIANLADLAGKVNVTVRADSPEGFDKGKLQNGVLEPLRESDLIS